MYLRQKLFKLHQTKWALLLVVMLFKRKLSAFLRCVYLKHKFKLYSSVLDSFEVKIFKFKGVFNQKNKTKLKIPKFCYCSSKTFVGCILNQWTFILLTVWAYIRLPFQNTPSLRMPNMEAFAFSSPSFRKTYYEFLIYEMFVNLP